MAIAILIFLAAFLYGAWDGLRYDFTFWQFAGRFLAMLYLLIACAGYHQFGFNRKEQVARIIVFLFVALFAAWVCTLF